MINKQGLWFLTLFSLILVLSVYYITMPNEIFQNEQVVLKNQKEETERVNKENTSYIETLKIELDSERTEIIDTLQEIINDSTKSVDEKNNAYEQIKEINSQIALESEIEKKLKKEFSLNTYVKQEEDKVEVIVEKDEHDVSLANKIMRKVQEEYQEPMNISVKFS